MAGCDAQNASHPHSHFSRDIPSANSTLSYTGGVAAQCAVDSSTDLDEYLTGPLDMHSETIPRSFPPGHLSRARIASQLAAFSGDPAFPSSTHYYLTRDSQPGPQNYSAGNRQSIDLSSDPSSSTSHHHSDLPWTSLDVTGTPVKARRRQTRPTSSSGFPRTPNNPVDPFSGFQHSRFHDSAIGTISGPSHDERLTVLSSSLTEMDPPSSWYYGLEPQEVQPQHEEKQEGELLDKQDEDIAKSQSEHEDNQPRAKQKAQRLSRSKEELTCTVPDCGTISKTPSDFKKHQARHNAPFTCDFQDCPRASRGFATVNDLDRHKKSVHKENARGTKYYKCFALNCPKAEKEWPRLDNFKQHLSRMHDDQDVDELVERSEDWYEEYYGSSAPTQSQAVTNVLHSQEEAARASGRSKKRRRDTASPNPTGHSQKRIAAPCLQTQGMPDQDFSHLSPLSAQTMTRLASSYSRQPVRSPSSYTMQNMRFASYQGHRIPQQAQLQASNQQARVLPVSSQRRGTEGQVRPVMQSLNPATGPYSFTSNDLYAFDTVGPAARPPPHDQRSQVLSKAPHAAPQQRPYSAPGDQGDYNHIRVAFIEESHPVPPGQEDADTFDMGQYLAGWGAGTSIPQSSPETSNEPHTPNQSTQLPVIAVDNESDDEAGKMKENPGSLVDEVNSLLHQHGTKGHDGRLQLSTRSLRSFLQSVASMSSRASTSHAQTSHKSTTGSTSSRAGKATHSCPKCCKSYPRQSDLKKHMKRHSRPYGCVLDDCYKCFGSKDDLKRHELNMHSEQKECYRCDGSHRGEDGQQCFKVFYHGRDNYKNHLERCLVRDPHQIEKKANACRIPANNQGRFWCGFCNEIVEHETYGAGASSQRLSHIDNHFSQGKVAYDWIELGGNGLTKQKVEIKHNEARKQQIQARASSHRHHHEEEDSRTSSSSSSSDTQEVGGPVHTTQSSQSPTQYQMQAPLSQRQRSNNAQYQQMAQQQIYQHQLGQQNQRARSHGQATQRAADFRDPPEKRYNEHGQRLSRHATCCRCDIGDWALELGKQCTNCDHHLCQSCRVR